MTFSRDSTTRLLHPVPVKEIDRESECVCAMFICLCKHFSHALERPHRHPPSQWHILCQRCLLCVGGGIFNIVNQMICRDEPWARRTPLSSYGPWPSLLPFAPFFAAASYCPLHSHTQSVTFSTSMLLSPSKRRL